MRAVLVAAVLGLLPAVAAADVTLDEVIDRVEERYAKLNDLRAAFRQTAFNKSLNQTIPSEGVVYLKKGGKMRWEYGAPTPQQIVSDGKSLWIYTPELNQVNVGEAPRVLAGPAGSFLAGMGKLRTFFVVRFLNPARKTTDKGDYVLDLRPRKPEPGLTRLVVEVDPREYLVRSAELFDQFDNTVRMRFTNVAANAGLPEWLFSFTPPKGVATVPLDGR
jgi:outer membrane lipoprotein carrier protein